MNDARFRRTGQVRTDLVCKKRLRIQSGAVINCRKSFSDLRSVLREELRVNFLRDLFVLADHEDHYAAQHDYVEGNEPGVELKQHQQVKHVGAQVERQHVGKLHVLAAPGRKGLRKLAGDSAAVLLYGQQQFLRVGRQRLLGLGVQVVHGKVEAVVEGSVLAVCYLFADAPGGGEERLVAVVQKRQMQRAEVVRHAGLLAVAVTVDYEDYPDVYAPFYCGEGDGLVGHAQAERKVDGKEIDYVHKAVQEASELAGGAGHAGDLSVRAVQDHGKELDEYAKEVYQDVLRVEEETSDDAKDQRQQGDLIGADFMLYEEVGKEHGERAVDCGVELVFRVVGLLRGCQILLQLLVPFLDLFQFDLRRCGVIVLTFAHEWFLYLSGSPVMRPRRACIEQAAAQSARLCASSRAKSYSIISIIYLIATVFGIRDR